MVKITPAILTTEKLELTRLLNLYRQYFDSIDIDIQEQPFASKPVLHWESVLEVIAKADLPQNISIGWDLKIAQPKAAVEAIMQMGISQGRQQRIYVYSTAQIDFVSDLIRSGEFIGLGILGKTNLRGIEFINQFPEVQIMTIGKEEQGTKLDPFLLDRVTELRSEGYEGLISIDGGVNLNSAELINAYAKEIRLDRVSVGSYFQKSNDLVASLQKLNIAINIGVQT